MGHISAPTYDPRLLKVIPVHVVMTDGLADRIA